MTYSWDALLHTLAETLSELAGVPVEPSELVPPPNAKLGDLAYGCFRAAKAHGRSPVEIATELADKLKETHQIISQVTATGPYINISFEVGEVVQRIVKDVEQRGSSFGRLERGQERGIMVEYAQPNTHKEIHVGHLRNLALGSSLVRLLDAAGWHVVSASYHGDVGAHVAKCLWFFVRSSSSRVSQPRPKQKKNDPPFEPLDPEAWARQLLSSLSDEQAEEMIGAIPREDRTGKFLGQMYASSSRYLDDHPECKEEVSEVQRKLESRDSAWVKLWLETRRWSLEEMRALFEEFHVPIDRQYLESEVVDDGQKIVDELLRAGIAKESQGAIVVDLEDKHLGIFLIRKSDGTSLYATKDLQLAKLKDREYPNLAKSLVVVDNRQSFYFQQLFATLSLLGIQHPTEFVGYEFVTLKSGAMSSREGNVVTLEAFRDEVLAYALSETRTRHPDWTEGKVHDVAWKLMMAGVKFGMLRQDSDKIFVFDMEQALSFDGATGPYVQYAVTRLHSLLKRVGIPAATYGTGDLLLVREDVEKRVALSIADFPHAIARAAEELRPSLIAQWSLEMAGRINDFYRDVKVLESPEDVKLARLRLVAAAKRVLEQGLDLLGIPVPEEM